MSDLVKQALAHVLDKQDLSSQQMQDAMNAIMQGEATPAQIAGLIIALRMKGETVDEITAAAQVMRNLSSKVVINAASLVDTCGTGGDGQHTFNVSTASAIVAASAGVVIAKHGNRSVSSSTGSADVLEVLGVKLELSPQQIAACVETTGIGFMFAPMHHSCMKHAVGPRKELGVRTLFNLLGPLTNPAAAQSQVLGVFDRAWLRPLASVLNNLGSQRALVVHAEDGLDEISIRGKTYVCELAQGEMTEYEVTPDQLGVDSGSLADITVENAEQSASVINDVFNGMPGPAANIVALNAGAAIYVAGRTESLEEGVDLATLSIQSGVALQKLTDLVDYTNNLSNT